MSYASPPRVYLAGPEVFLPNPLELADQKKAICARYGLQGVFPFDANVDVSRADHATGITISAANEELMRGSVAIIANMTPFRGPSMDVGTAYEMGYGRALGLVVCGYTNVEGSLVERTLAAVGGERGSDGVLRDPDGMAIEEFEMIDNLMMPGAVEGSGGVLVVRRATNGERFTYLSGFEECVKHLAQALRVQ